ncbi:MAG: cation:proton antiporter [Egibacteraceae bacterium]
MGVELPADTVILIAAAILASGVLGSAFAQRLRVPALLLFLGVGMLIADGGLALVRFADARVAQAGATVALAVILFEDGLTTKPRDIRRARCPAFCSPASGSSSPRAWAPWS